MAGRRKRPSKSPDLGTVEGAVPAAMPGFVPPQLATLKPRPPGGAGWIHEIKFDGYRAQAHVSADGTRIFTRTGLNWTKRFSAIWTQHQMAMLALKEWEQTALKPAIE